jgi:hypothetical protein
MKLTVKFSSLFFLCLPILATLSCERSHEQSKKYHPIIDDVHFEKKAKVLLTIGVDISESFKFPRIPPHTIKSICQTIADSRVNGKVAIQPIGNPTDSLIHVLEVWNPPIEDTKALLSIRKKQRQLQKKVYADNVKNINAFVDRYEKTIYSIESERFTDIHGFLDMLTVFYNEPDFHDYEKIVLLYSDGKQSVNGNENLIYPPIEKLKGIKFYGVGIKNKKIIADLNITLFASIEGFNSYINNHLINKSN